jgi:CheY-like chemotaxis protein
LNTILLIEDDPDCARMVKKLLVPAGYAVEHAACGLTGLQLARQLIHNTELGLILVDINLPDLTGNVVIVQLRASICHSAVPIVAFTAEPGPRAKRIAHALGCDGFLSKPIDPKAFPSQIAAFFNAEPHLATIHGGFHNVR